VNTLSISLKKAPTTEEIEEICGVAEEAARASLLGKVSAKRLEDLNIVVEATGSKPLSLSVEVSADLAAGNEDMKSLVQEATNAAFNAAEEKVMELGLCKTPRDSSA
jgi:hypothetical protein